ncbi:alpha-isopropylmalate synthase regulatory domain-containing protein [uncultured Thiohalocapsa sp.]|uniref:alpha-isopropylmalate synthase regulatory domain-containing protein n=1 Tax=uncultured Thiohalocapsa sp. TaxID=768990 RepID=UPI00260122BD|nr:alpha-isopropylmalate synthase regulatory domain-containing protein [uncultured Thiohalocapsa sp.]
MSIEQNRILILDTTLRDGEQTQGVAFSPDEKAQIAQVLLEQLRLDRIEVASARVSRGEQAALARIIDWAAGRGLDGRVEVLGFVDDGRSIDWIRDAGGRVMNLLAKGSRKHCETQLRKTLDHHAEDIRRNVALARERGLAVNLYLEDWSNGYTDDPAYVYALLERLADAGVGHFMLPDTLGVMTPEKVFTAIMDMIRRFPACRFDFHPHNDYGLATANVVAAAQAGVACVHCTVNCLGERAGNASLAEVVVNLRDQLDMQIGIDEQHLARASELVQYFSGKRIADNAPVVGEDVFTQTAGIHADGDHKGGLYATRLSPERFGRRRVYALGKLAGKASLAKNLERLGVHLSEEQQRKVLARIVELGDSKKRITFEDLPFIIAEVLDSSGYNHAELLACNVSSSLGLQSTASIKLRLQDEVHTAAGSGNGGFDAFNKALAEITGRAGLILPRLVDYEVRIPKGGRTDALTECTITWAHRGPAAPAPGPATAPGSEAPGYPERAGGGQGLADGPGDAPAKGLARAAGKRHGEFKTRGVHANQVFASINAAMRMLNLVVHWSVAEAAAGAAAGVDEDTGAAQHVA